VVFFRDPRLEDSPLGLQAYQLARGKKRLSNDCGQKSTGLSSRMDDVSLAGLPGRDTLFASGFT
jgi:hypothetical protein